MANQKNQPGREEQDRYKKDSETARRAGQKGGEESSNSSRKDSEKAKQADKKGSERSH